jgi:hypothetical protein
MQRLYQKIDLLLKINIDKKRLLRRWLSTTKKTWVNKKKKYISHKKNNISNVFFFLTNKARKLYSRRW